MSKTDFEDDYDSQLISERALQIIAQAILDIGNHLIAHHGWGKPESYREVITILVKRNIIHKQHQSELEGLAGLRNILVHDYLTIKPNLIFDDIRNGIEAIEYFLEVMINNYG
jgi:uncharacterized protein YutE (UPF0331/DUF86 family)